MQNEFEKQVQKKLEELDLVPTPPVWQNIEKQIRKEKERRRIIFWIPLGILLLVGAGTWFWISGNDDAGINPVTVTSQTETKGQGTIIPGETAKYEEADNKPESKLNPEPNRNTTSFQENNNREKSVMTSETIPANTPGVNRNSTNKNKTTFHREQNAVVQQKKPVEKHIPDASLTDQKQSEAEISDTKKIVAAGIVSDNKINAGNNKSSSDPAAVSKTDSAKKKDTVVKDVVISAKVAEATTVNSKPANKKWKLGITGGIGFSGEGTGIDLNSEKSMDQLSTGSSQSPPLQTGPNPGTPINKELAFSLGIAVKKELSHRFALVSGLNFNYYTSSRDVGEQMQDSTLPAGIFISRFYLNSGQVANNVTSKYYFISLPVMIDWKFIASESFHLQAGVSIQQLISSNAIQYDPVKGIYYKDPSSLKKTQVFTNFNLGYEFGFRNKSSLMLGPSIQYGLNKLSEKENKHLFFAGIQAQYFFK